MCLFTYAQILILIFCPVAVWHAITAPCCGDARKVGRAHKVILGAV